MTENERIAGMKHCHRVISAGMVLSIVASGHMAIARHSNSDYAESIHHAPKVSAPTRIIRAWRKLEVDTPVYTIDDQAAAPGWLSDALIQKITFQTGVWNIYIEPGYTVYRIYPYIGLQPPKDSPRAYECLVIKVKGDSSVAYLRKAIKKRLREVVIDAFSLSGAGVDIFKRSRSPKKVRKEDGGTKGGAISPPPSKEKRGQVHLR